MLNANFRNYHNSNALFAVSFQILVDGVARRTVVTVFAKVAQCNERSIMQVTCIHVKGVLV